MRVIVCDDEKESAEQVANVIRDLGVAEEVDPISDDDLKDAFDRLFERVGEGIANPKKLPKGDPSLFDEYDLVIVDNILTHLHLGARLTAEDIVGYLRAFSTAGYIVSLNKNTELDFDLAHLVGEETRADVALNADHLENLGLWTGSRGDAPDHFRPWYWPVLNDAADRRRKQVEFIRAHIQDAVMPSLGLPVDDASLGFLSLEARSALSPSVQDRADNDGVIQLDRLTFRDVLAGSPRTIPGKADRDSILGAIGDNPEIAAVAARLIAAEIEYWVRRFLIAPQDMLVDLPHLVARMPFLLGPAAGEANAWNACLETAAPPFGLDQGLYREHLEPVRLSPLWAPRPTFVWPALKGKAALNDLFFAEVRRGVWPNLAFCEDRSAFLPREGNEPPIEFSSSLEGPWARRFVGRVEGRRYKPQASFAQ